MPASPVNSEGTVAQRLSSINTNTGASLTNSQLRASPVPISGTVSASGPLTNDELRSIPITIFNQDCSAMSVVSDLGKSVSLTLPKNGLIYNITYLEIIKYSTLNILGGVTPITITTSNLNELAFTFGTAILIGQTDKILLQLNNPIKGQEVDSDIVITCPETSGIIWRINCFYYQKNP